MAALTPNPSFQRTPDGAAEFQRELSRRIAVPNGDDKNLVRFCAAVNGFRSRYKKWPSRVVLEPGYIADLRHILSKADFAKVSAVVQLVPKKGVHIRAEGDGSESYDYSLEGFAKEEPDIDAYKWFGLE